MVSIGQRLQEDIPSEKVPVGHGEHAWSPASAFKYPGSHGTQLPLVFVYSGPQVSEMSNKHKYAFQ